MMTIQSLQSFETLCGMLERNDIEYSRNDEHMAVHCTVSGTDIPIRVMFVLRPCKMLATLYALMPVSVEKSKAADMGLAVCLANKSLTDGCFVYDMDEGSVFFKMTASFRDGEVGYDSFEYMLSEAADIVDEYYPKFERIAKHTQSLIRIDGAKDLMSVNKI